MDSERHGFSTIDQHHALLSVSGQKYPFRFRRLAGDVIDSAGATEDFRRLPMLAGKYGDAAIEPFPLEVFAWGEHQCSSSPVPGCPSRGRRPMMPLPRQPLRQHMRDYTFKEKAKITAGAVAALVIVAWLAVVALGILSSG